MNDRIAVVRLEQDDRALARVVDHLRAGGLIAYPTETVYGYGCLLRADALVSLAKLKGRSAEKAFLVLVTERCCIPGLQWESSAEDLAEEFWPGPLTLALRAGPKTPAGTIAADGTMAVRSSPHPVPRRIIDAVGEPLTSTSANLSGDPAALSAASVVAALSVTDFPGDILVIDGGELQPSASSTIVSFAGPRPRIVRHGAISAEEIRRVAGELDE